MTEATGTLNRRAVLLAGSALMLAGCGDIIGPSATPKQLYTLTPNGSAAAAGQRADFSLAVAAGTDSQYLDSTRIALTHADGSLDYYADAAWTDRLSVLARNALVEAFEASERIAAVAPESEGFQADYLLECEIRDFEARYPAPDAIPTVRIRIVSKLAPTHGRAIIADLESVHEAAATQNSVAAVVRAFDDALGPVLADIVAWALAAPKASTG